MQTLMRPDFETLSKNFRHWEKTADLIDQCIDLTLNLRQSGHPGGSRLAGFYTQRFKLLHQQTLQPLGAGHEERTHFSRAC